MIDARELRIGNNILDNGIVIQVTPATIMDIVQYRVDYYRILLTPAILEKCGFIKVKKTEYYIVSNKDAGTILIVNVIDNEYSLSCFPVVFQYLHQLQNLYYSLTNTELNFKP